MCENCTPGAQLHSEDRGFRNPNFTGFFSPEAIEAALRNLEEAQAERKAEQRARRHAALVNNDGLRNDISSSSSLADSSESDGEDNDDEDFSDSDDDGT